MLSLQKYVSCGILYLYWQIYINIFIVLFYKDKKTHFLFVLHLESMYQWNLLLMPISLQFYKYSVPLLINSELWHFKIINGNTFLGFRLISCQNTFQFLIHTFYGLFKLNCFHYFLNTNNMIVHFCQFVIVLKKIFLFENRCAFEAHTVSIQKIR